MRFLAATGLLLSLFAVTACTKESMPGGPGASQGPVDATTDTTTTHRDGTVTPTEPMPDAAAPTTRPTPTAPVTVDSTDAEAVEDNREENTFTLHVPSAATNIEQGAMEAVEVSIDRGDLFQQPVTLSFETPAGVKIEPANPTIPADLEKAEVSVHVDQTAELGEKQIRVLAKPQTGKAVELMMAIEVTQP